MAKDYIKFDKARLAADLDNLVKKTAIATMSAIFTHYRANLAANNISPLDKDYLTAMLEDITPMNVTQLDNVLRATQGIGDRSTQNQSFRALYYEYGTGELARRPMGYSESGDPFRNPARGSSKKFHYWRDKHTDLGNNPRRGTGKDYEIPEGSPYAQPIQPGFNLKRAVLTSQPGMIRSLREGVSQLNPIAYTKVRGINVRM